MTDDVAAIRQATEEREALNSSRLALLPSLQLGVTWVSERSEELFPGYRMGSAQPLDPKRLEAFFDKKLTIRELATFAQDLIECGRSVQALGPSALRLINHYVEEGLCTTMRLWQ